MGGRRGAAFGDVDALSKVFKEEIRKPAWLKKLNEKNPRASLAPTRVFWGKLRELSGSFGFRKTAVRSALEAAIGDPDEPNIRDSFRDEAEKADWLCESAKRIMRHAQLLGKIKRDRPTTRWFVELFAGAMDSSAGGSAAPAALVASAAPAAIGDGSAAPAASVLRKPSAAPTRATQHVTWAADQEDEPEDEEDGDEEDEDGEEESPVDASDDGDGEDEERSAEKSGGETASESAAQEPAKRRLSGKNAVATSAPLSAASGEAPYLGKGKVYNQRMVVTAKAEPGQVTAHFVGFDWSAKKAWRALQNSEDAEREYCDFKELKQKQDLVIATWGDGTEGAVPIRPVDLDHMKKAYWASEGKGPLTLEDGGKLYVQKKDGGWALFLKSATDGKTTTLVVVSSAGFDDSGYAEVFAKELALDLQAKKYPVEQIKAERDLRLQRRGIAIQEAANQGAKRPAASAAEGDPVPKKSRSDGKGPLALEGGNKLYVQRKGQDWGVFMKKPESSNMQCLATVPSATFGSYSPSVALEVEAFARELAVDAQQKKYPIEDIKAEVHRRLHLKWGSLAAGQGAGQPSAASAAASSHGRERDQAAESQIPEERPYLKSH